MRDERAAIRREVERIEKRLAQTKDPREEERLQYDLDELSREMDAIKTATPMRLERRRAE